MNTSGIIAGKGVIYNFVSTYFNNINKNVILGEGVGARKLRIYHFSARLTSPISNLKQKLLSQKLPFAQQALSNGIVPRLWLRDGINHCGWLFEYLTQGER